MKLTKDEWLHASMCIGPSLITIGLIGMALGCVANAQTVSTTNVQGTVCLVNGLSGAGTLEASRPTFTTAISQVIAKLTESQLTTTGGTLSAPLYLSGDPTQALHAADKHYVDSAFDQSVLLAGARMTGWVGWGGYGFFGPLTGNVTGTVSGSASNVTGVVQPGNGGTGATKAAEALAFMGAQAAIPGLSGDGAATPGIQVAGTVVAGTAIANVTNNIVNAAQYAGSDCGAKINTADAAWAGTGVEIDVNQACGTTWTTPISLSTSHNLKITQAGTYIVAPLSQFAGNNDVGGLGNSTILMVAPQTICPGEGTAWVHHCNTSPNAIGGTFYANGSNITFHDFNFDGNLSNQPTISYGTVRVKGIVIMPGVVNPTVRNVNFTNWSFEALQAVGDTSTYDATGQITVATPAVPIVNLQVLNNTFDNIGGGAVDLEDVNGFSYTGNICANVATLTPGVCLGYELTQTQNNMVVTNNTFSTQQSNTYGFAQGSYHPLLGYKGCVVSGNIFTNGGAGFECDHASITNNTFTNPLIGTASGSWRQGIEIYGSDLVIANNNISEAEILFAPMGAGINTSRIKAYGNVITNGGAATGCMMIGGGMTPYGSMDQIDISNNTCDLTGATDSSSRGFQQFAAQLITNMKTENNTVTGPSTARGISIQAATSGSGPFTFSNNKLRGLGTGIYVSTTGQISELNLLNNDLTGDTTPVSLSGATPTMYRKCGNILTSVQTDLAIGCGIMASDIAGGVTATGFSGASAWMRNFGDGSGGAYSCASGTCAMGGESWYSSFNVSAGATVTMAAANQPLVIRSTGTCTIAGTLSVSSNTGGAGNTQTAIYGGSGGGGGGGTAAGAAGLANYISPGGTAGAASGGTGGNGATLPIAYARTLYSTGYTYLGSSYSAGGAPGGAGGSSGGAGGKGGGMLVLVCPTINFTGTVDASGGAGGASTANNTGAGAGGGGGVVAMSAQVYSANTGTINVSGGAGGSCGHYTGCGDGGVGGTGNKYQATIH